MCRQGCPSPGHQDRKDWEDTWGEQAQAGAPALPDLTHFSVAVGHRFLPAFPSGLITSTCSQRFEAPRLPKERGRRGELGGQSGKGCRKEPVGLNPGGQSCPPAVPCSGVGEAAPEVLQGPPQSPFGQWGGCCPSPGDILQLCVP